MRLRVILGDNGFHAAFRVTMTIEGEMMMDSITIVREINALLHTAAGALADWLGKILPRVTNTWWEDCVISSLSYSQRNIARERNFSKLSDFDLAALLRIANKSWYDMRTVVYLPASERECIREMMGVRNNWAHCSTELLDKDTILHDLKVIRAFIQQMDCEKNISVKVDELISYIEQPDSVAMAASRVADSPQPVAVISAPEQGIAKNSLVYLVSDPQKRGVVIDITELGETTKYSVFIDNAIHTYYTGQIEPAIELADYRWIHVDRFRNLMTAYQINHPSGQNLYSLNSARIDFVPYQFRPALKMIHADEPRILIADSVGVGKTIEAGLIIKELSARQELEKILIICPRPLVAERKWEVEMKRFDEEFIPLDGAALRQAISDMDRDGEWPQRYNKAIVPYSIMDSRLYHGESSGRSKSFGLLELDPPPHFDLVIVDEAHHIRNGSMEKEKAFAYKCTKYFCDHADAVVMLTATPLQTGDNDLFTLLNVLRPDIVIDQKTFQMMSRPNEYISGCIRAIRSAKEDWQSQAAGQLIQVRKTQWGDSVVVANPLYDSVLNRLSQKNISREERVQLISDVESLHSFSTLINRTRRRDIQDFCIRHSITVETEFTPEQRQLHDELLRFEASALAALHNVRSVPFMISTIRRQAASCIFGLVPHIRDIIERRFKSMNDDPEFDENDYDLDSDCSDKLVVLAKNVLEIAKSLPENDPKFEKTYEIILQKQTAENNKIMLFSTFRYTLAYLKEKLRAKGLRVEQVDGSVKDEQRYELKRRFELKKSEPEAIDVLLFTEVGAEGLDYQFCDTMINYDLPWNPMRIEQRIGRIDRRGQQSEAVNIYNIITQGTVDADIYNRCLKRIGVFENSIGECEEILGEIASQIEQIVLDSKLTDAERKTKLEQIADNEVRKIMELNRLEDEEKELFGFDLSEFITTQEIRRAENPWLSQGSLQLLITNYLQERLGAGMYILGDGANKTLRLSASARVVLREDLRNMPGSRSAVRRAWENYLGGKKATIAITFDAETASQNRESMFITAVHPFAKQAAKFFSTEETSYLKIKCESDSLPAGSYPFSVYAWRYTGSNPSSRLITICENAEIARELPDILENNPKELPDQIDSTLSWNALDLLHAQEWKVAKDKYLTDAANIAMFKIESLENTHRNRVRSLEQQINDTYDDLIRRMKMSELEAVQTDFQKRVDTIRADQARSDIHTALLANGMIVVEEV